MTVLVRREFHELRDEALKRIGRSSDSAASTRMERFMEAAYYRLALTYHHYELEDEDTATTASPSANTVAVPANTYIVLGVSLRAVSGGAFLKSLVFQSANSLLANADRATSRRPGEWGRVGETLFFDSKPDQAYPLSIYRYKRPAAPDFDAAANAVSELDPLWDEAIIELALMLGFTAYWSDDLAKLSGEALASFLKITAQPLLAQHTIHPQVEAQGRPHGGAQG